MTAELVAWGRVQPVAARVNWGRWVGDCSACPSAWALAEWQSEFVCADCGALVPVVWPAAQFVTGVERLLSMRPDPQTRNWSTGESLHDLLLENAAHGIFSHPALEGLHRPGLELLTVTDDRIVVDRLPDLPALSARVPRQIGA